MKIGRNSADFSNDKKPMKPGPAKPAPTKPAPMVPANALGVMNPLGRKVPMIASSGLAGPPTNVGMFPRAPAPKPTKPNPEKPPRNERPSPSKKPPRNEMARPVDKRFAKPTYGKRGGA